MIKLPLLNQCDPKWKDRILAPSALTMGGYGCYVTSLAILISNYAINLKPDEVLSKLVQANGFTDDGLLKYDGVERAFRELVFYERIYTANDKSNNFSRMQVDVAIKKVLRSLRLGIPPILAVDNVLFDKNPDHAVVLESGTEALTDWMIINPDGGKRQRFVDKYGNPEQTLYGAVFIAGSPIEFPPDGDARVGQAIQKLFQAKKGFNRDQNVSEAIGILLGA